MAFTSDQTKPQLAVIDTSTNKVKTWVPLPAPGYGTAATDDGQWLVVAMSTANQVAVKVGVSRQFFRSPTATLDELECHVTTLNPGESSHPPHKHPDEELVIIKEGTVEGEEEH